MLKKFFHKFQTENVSLSAAEPEELPVIPFNYIVGYRYWKVIYEQGQPKLASPYLSKIWESKIHSYEKTARCSVNHLTWQRMPVACSCGLYALFSLDQILPRWAFYNISRPFNSVAGIVIGSGRIIVHGEGFRAERLQIVCFIQKNKDTSPNKKALLKVLSKFYDVPVIPEAQADYYYQQLKGDIQDVYPTSSQSALAAEVRQAEMRTIKQGFALMGAMGLGLAATPVATILALKKHGANKRSMRG